MRELHERLRDEVRQRFQRAVPFADELFDRWERASHLGFGEGASIYDSSLVIGDVHVGDDTWVGPFTVLDGSSGLTVGHHCSVSAGVQIYSHDTVEWALTGGMAPKRQAPTRIGDCTYVGPNAVIVAGVTIGSHCVIGAGALVNADVPDHRVVFGVPGRIVGRVEIAGERASVVYDAEAEDEDEDDS